MGNRAVIAFKSMPEVGIYLHWNGGRESVEAFLQATRERKSRSPAGDPCYAFARLVQTTADFFCRGDNGELLSIGAGPMNALDCDNGDNGVYWIGDDWSIVERSGKGYRVQNDVLSKADREKTADIVAVLLAIDAEREQAYRAA